MVGITIKQSSKDKALFRKQLKSYGKKLGVNKEQILDTLALEVQGDARKILDSQGTSDRGQLKKSITIRKLPLGTRRIGTNTNYGLYVEFGRPAGTMPNRKHLLGWVKRKLGINGKEAEGVAFVIARAIGERGTKAQPFLRPAYERGKRRLLIMMRKKLIK